MSERGERDIPTEEVLLRDDIREAFRMNADIVGISTLDNRNSTTVTVLAGMVPDEEETEGVMLANFIAPDGETTVITLFDLQDPQENLHFILRSDGLFIIPDGPTDIDQDEVLEDLRAAVAEAEWDAELSHARAQSLRRSRRRL